MPGSCNTCSIRKVTFVTSIADGFQYKNISFQFILLLDSGTGQASFSLAETYTDTKKNEWEEGGGINWGKMQTGRFSKRESHIMHPQHKSVNVIALIPVI